MPTRRTSAAAAPADNAELLCAADHPAQPVRRLWPERIPVGKVTLLVGDPGEGKSLVALDIAARVSRGAEWPNQEDASTAPADPGSVLILSAEDDLQDTIRPRLDAASADPSRVFLMPSVVDLRNDLDKLRSALDRIPDCRLIIIDPVSAYVGPGDSHFQTVVRRVFQPLAQLAAEKQLAIVAISHLRKTEGAAIQRAAGSMGFVSTVRSAWTVCRDPHQPERHLLLPLKNNFVADTTGLAYTIASPAADSQCPAITWRAADVTTSAEEALSSPLKSRGPEAVESRAAAKWLRDRLADGPAQAMFIAIEGSDAGFSERTLRRALHSMGGKTTKGSWDFGWRWSLPSDEGESLARTERESPTPADSSENLAASTETCPLRENTHISDTDPRPLAADSDPHSQQAPHAPIRSNPVPPRRSRFATTPSASLRREEYRAGPKNRRSIAQMAGAVVADLTRRIKMEEKEHEHDAAQTAESDEDPEEGKPYRRTAANPIIPRCSDRTLPDPSTP